MRRLPFVHALKLGLTLLAIAGCGRALAAKVPAEAPRDFDLHLVVLINDYPTGLIAKFHHRSNGRLAIAITELREVGLKTDRLRTDADDLVDLESLKGVTFRYDIAAQVIRFTATPAALIPRIVDTSGRRPSDAPLVTGTGTVLNYLIFANSGRDDGWNFDFFKDNTSLSTALDLRAFSPYGVLSQSGILSTSDLQGGFLRLDSTWTYSDPRSMTTVRAGDLISGGLGWTRSVRLGGAQVQRNFGLRPDLVTMPMPFLGGTAAVPSTVDVYVNNLRTYSGDLPPGPFEVRNVPIISGAGTQRIVIRDSLGRETVTNLPYYASSKLLQAGLLDYSVETGFARLSYGSLSNDYDSSPAVSASARYGVSNRLTVEGHAEATDNLLNAGVGIVMPLWSTGLGSFAVAGSQSEGRSGALYSVSFEFGTPFATFYGRSQRTFSDYMDIAAVTATRGWAPQALALLSSRPPKAIDQASLTLPLRFDPSSLTLSFTHLRDALDTETNIIAMSYSRPVSGKASFYVTSFANVSGDRNYGIFGGLTVALDGGVSANAGIATTRSHASYGAELVKSQPLEPGTYGWRLRARGGDPTDLAASGSYRTSFARLEASAEKVGETSLLTAQAEGAIVHTAGRTFFTNRVDDAFAVVDAGAPDVDVFFDNRPVGKTNAQGVALVPNLRSYESNVVSIDAKNLPVDADVPKTKEQIRPADRAGVVIKFGINQIADAALVSFLTRDGKPIAPGSHGTLMATGENFIVGYDGQAYIRGLRPNNKVSIERPDGSRCHASFIFQPEPGAQVRIGGVSCR